MRAAECEKCAAAASNLEVRSSYVELARRWRTIARDIDDLEGQMNALAADKNSE
jgi:hypothetical protein